MEPPVGSKIWLLIAAESGWVDCISSAIRVPDLPGRGPQGFGGRTDVFQFSYERERNALIRLDFRPFILKYRHVAMKHSARRHKGRRCSLGRKSYNTEWEVPV